jgi:hypothetical protein
LLQTSFNRRSKQRVMTSQILGVQTEIISGFLLRSFGTKSHSDVGAAERHRVYYMGEGGGFPRVRAVVSHVSPKLPVACTSTKGTPESELIGLMQVRISN